MGTITTNPLHDIKALSEQSKGVRRKGVKQTAHEDPYRWECRTGDARSIVLMGSGLLADGWIDTGTPQYIVTDEPTWKAHGDRVTAALTTAGTDFTVYVAPSREEGFTSGVVVGLYYRVPSAVPEGATVVGFGAWWTLAVAGSVARRARDGEGVPWVRVGTSLAGLLSGTADLRPRLDHPSLGKEPGDVGLYPPVVSYADPALLVPALSSVGGLAALLQVAVALDDGLFGLLKDNRSAIASGWWTSGNVPGLLARALDKLLRDRWADPTGEQPHPPSRVGSLLTGDLARRSAVPLGVARSVDLAHVVALAVAQGVVSRGYAARVYGLMDYFGMPCTDPALSRTQKPGVISGVVLPDGKGGAVAGLPTTMEMFAQAGEKLFGTPDGDMPGADAGDEPEGEPGADAEGEPETETAAETKADSGDETGAEPVTET